MPSGIQRPPYPEKRHATCPRCGSERIAALPANNPGSDQEWFRCSGCDHLWTLRRDRTPQGDQPPQPDPPEGEGEGGR